MWPRVPGSGTGREIEGPELILVAVLVLPKSRSRGTPERATPPPASPPGERVSFLGTFLGQAGSQGLGDGDKCRSVLLGSALPPAPRPALAVQRSGKRRPRAGRFHLGTPPPPLWHE